MLDPFGSQQYPGSYVNLQKGMLQRVQSVNIDDQIFEVVQKAYEVALKEESIVLSRPERKRLLVRVHNIVNHFISKKAQDIVNCISLLTGRSSPSMLSPKVREHGRETRVSIAPEGDPNAFAGQFTTRPFGKSSSQSRLAEQMAKTFRPTRHFGSSQSFATTPSHAKDLRIENDTTDCPNPVPFGETKNRLDRRSCDPARGAQSERRQILAVALDDQTGVAQAWLDCQVRPGSTSVFSQTLEHRVGHLTRSGLDVSVSRRRSQDLRLSYLEFAYSHLLANHCHRQELRNGPGALPGHLENPGNPTVLATRQRCRVLWWLQSAAHLRAVRSAMFVSGHRTHLLAHCPTRVQWRSRRIERLVGARLLGTPTVHLLHPCPSHQSSLRPLVYDGVCTADLGRCDSPTSTATRTHLSLERQTVFAFARSVADYRWTDPFHSPGQARWHDYRSQRILEGQQALGR